MKKKGRSWSVEVRRQILVWDAAACSVSHVLHSDTWASLTAGRVKKE